MYFPYIHLYKDLPVGGLLFPVAGLLPVPVAGLLLAAVPGLLDVLPAFPVTEKVMLMLNLYLSISCFLFSESLSHIF